MIVLRNGAAILHLQPSVTVVTAQIRVIIVVDILLTIAQTAQVGIQIIQSIFCVHQIAPVGPVKKKYFMEPQLKLLLQIPFLVEKLVGMNLIFLAAPLIRSK